MRYFWSKQFTIGLLFLLSFSASGVEGSKPDSAVKPKATGPLNLFESKETRSENMRAFSRWTDMWRRHNLPTKAQVMNAKTKTSPQSAFEVRLPQNYRQRRRSASQTKEVGADRKKSDKPKCSRYNRIECKKADWDGFVKSKTSPLSKSLLDDVNKYMNVSAYIVDPVNWGMPDYWATPTEFFLKDGDCEDYAISKYVTLKRMGVDISKMRLVIVQDENLRIAHAVLAVTLEDNIYILDNQVNAVLPHNKIRHYRPVYSINEQAWWLHRKPRAR